MNKDYIRLLQKVKNNKGDNPVRIRLRRKLGKSFDDYNEQTNGATEIGKQLPNKLIKKYGNRVMRDVLTSVKHGGDPSVNGLIRKGKVLKCECCYCL